MNDFECPRCGHCCQAEVNMNTEAMQMALDMLNEIADDVYCDQKLEGVITALRQALETEQEPVQCEPQQAVTKDGWCEWVCPKPRGYLMQCCDCELIHEVDFRVVRYESEDSEVYEVVDDPNLQAQMRLRRRDDISPKKPHQEPVAWISDSPTKGNGKQLHWTKSEAWRWSSNITPLYTAPSKQWVGLTEEEIVAATNAVHGFGAIKQKDMNFAKAIEAKLKEKNT